MEDILVYRDLRATISEPKPTIMSQVSRYLLDRMVKDLIKLDLVDSILLNVNEDETEQHLGRTDSY